MQLQYFAYSVFLVLVRLKHLSVTNSDQKISVEDAYLDFRLEECSVPRGDPTSTLIFKISFSSNCKLLATGKRGVHCLYDRSCDSNRTSRQAGKKVRDRKKQGYQTTIMTIAMATMLLLTIPMTSRRIITMTNDHKKDQLDDQQDDHHLDPRYSALRLLHHNLAHLRGLTPPFPPKLLSSGTKVSQIWE